MTNPIQEKLWNIELVIKDIKAFPQTYNTILGELKDSGTCQTILRRKLSKLCKNGQVCKTTIPGTRFGQAIFYILPKKYYILVEATRFGSSVYCFFKFKKLSKYYLKISDCWKLNNSVWDKTSEKIFFEGDVLKFI